MKKSSAKYNAETEGTCSGTSKYLITGTQSHTVLISAVAMISEIL